jgi:hypothetical protein
MGYDIMAYFFVNQEQQEQISEFINQNNIDKHNSKQCTLIVDYYKTINPKIKEQKLIYIWNRNCEIHEFFDFYGIKFIRDDERFINKRFQQLLTEKYKREFPWCLTNIINLREGNDAIKIADALTIFFNDDDNLMSFAEWLRKTSTNGVMYELSR